MVSNLKLKNGQMLIIGILFLAILLIFSTTIFTKVRYFINFGTNSTLKEQARHAAEAGIDIGVRMIDPNDNHQDEGGTVGTTGTFFVDIVSISASQKTITATGYIPNSNPLQTKAKHKIQIQARATNTTIKEILNFETDHPSAVVVNDYLYVIGKKWDDNCNNSENVQFTSINNTTNTVNNNWQPTTRLPFGPGSSAVATPDGFIYAIGTPEAPVTGEPRCYGKNVYFAKPNPDGSISDWIQTTYSLPGMRAAHASVYYNGYIYVIGGSSNETCPLADYNGHCVIYSNIIRAEVDPDNDPNTGDLGQWSSPLPKVMQEYRREFAAVEANGFLYVLGGKSNVTTQGVEYAAIDTIGTFDINPNSLPLKTKEHSAVALNGYVYVLGGQNPVTNPSGNPGNRFSRDVYYAQINANNSLGPFSTSPNSLPITTNSNAAFAIDNDSPYNIYVVGGKAEPPYSTSLATCWYTTSTSNGNIGPWVNCDGSEITYSDWLLDKSTYIAK